MDKFNEIFRAIVLGLVQGLTEFLPVSSSFHLRLIPSVLNWPEVGISFSAFLHLGTLIAVLVYFGKDLINISLDAWKELTVPSFSFARVTNTLAWKIALGSIPAFLIGFFLHDHLEEIDKNLYLTAICLMVVAVILWFSDMQPSRKENIEKITWKESFMIGCGQAMALIPGVSRSGSTISVGRFLGYDRYSAARFSFLLGVPVILGAGVLEIIKLLRHSSDMEISLTACLIGCLTAALVGYFAIGFFLKFIQSASLLVFVIYRIALGLIVLISLSNHWIK